MEIIIPIYDGVDDLDAIGPHEVFSHARNAGADLSLRLCTLDGQERITSSHGLRVEPESQLPSFDSETPAAALPDMVVVPGGGWSTGGGAREQVAQGDLPAIVSTLAGRGVTVASVCTGAMILAAAGVTAGRPAVTHHSALTDLAESGAAVIEARVVDDGTLVTAGGITAGIDLALHLVEREFGVQKREAVERVMEYEMSSDIVVTEGTDRV